MSVEILSGKASYGREDARVRLEEEKFRQLAEIYSKLKLPQLCQSILDLWRLGTLSDILRSGRIQIEGDGEIKLGQRIEFSYEDIVNTSHRKTEGNGLNGHDVIIASTGDIGYKIGRTETSVGVSLFYQHAEDQYGVRLIDNVSMPMEGGVPETPLLYYQSGPGERIFTKYFSPDDRFINDASNLLFRKVDDFSKDRLKKGLLPYQLALGASERIARAKRI